MVSVLAMNHDSTTVPPSLDTFSSFVFLHFFAVLELQQHLLQHFSFGSACQYCFLLYSAALHVSFPN